MVVAGAAVGLKSKTRRAKLLDKQRNILDVAGLLVPKMSATDVLKVYDSRIKAKIVNFQTGELTDSKGNFDLNAALRSDDIHCIISSRRCSKIRRRANTAEVYFVLDEQGKTTEVVLPVYGSGLWSVMVCIYCG